MILVLTAFALLGGHAGGQTLRDVSGDVQVKGASSEALKKAEAGQQLAPHETLITGDDGSCRLIMPDKNALEIYPHTHFQIEEYSNDPAENKKMALFQLVTGKVRARVGEKYDGEKQLFQIHTPVAVAGVRGTDFILDYDKLEKTSQVTTLEGEVRFGRPGPNRTIVDAVPVAAGKRSVARSGKPPTKSEVVPKAQLHEMGKGTTHSEPHPKPQRNEKARHGHKGS